MPVCRYNAQVPLLYVQKCRWASLNVFLKDSVTGTGICITLPRAEHGEVLNLWYAGSFQCEERRRVIP